MSLKQNKPPLNFIVGTAAELIKLYPVIVEALKRGCQVRVLSTGQARENFLMQYRDFGLPEQILEFLVPSEGDLSRSTQALRWFLRALLVRKSHAREKLLTGDHAIVVVHGDTLSTLVGALLGRRLGLPVAHVEAGLRSPRLLNPFPEEITRRWVSRLADFHFAPNSEAETNLNRSGTSGLVINTQGNTLRDAVLMPSASQVTLPTELYALCNLHRFENLNSTERWQTLIKTTLRTAQKIKVVFVLHPQTRQRLENDPSSLDALKSAGVILQDRMSFSHFLAYLKGAEFLISDGGSNQEECSYLGKPCLLMRETTERPEGLDGPCLLSRFQTDLIERFINDWGQYRISTQENVSVSPSSVILDALLNPY